MQAMLLKHFSFLSVLLKLPAAPVWYVSFMGQGLSEKYYYRRVDFEELMMVGHEMGPILKTPFLKRVTF